MDLNFSVFQEPRGVMRILHLIFSISAFASISEYTGTINFSFNLPKQPLSSFTYKFSYPFQLYLNLKREDLKPLINSTDNNCTLEINGDFSSDAQFFVATGVLAMLFTLVIIFVYVKFDNLYKSNNRVQLTDFILTVIFSVLWLSSSAAWANGLSGLKHATDPANINWSCPCSDCPISTSGFSSLNVSVVLGFLNFFLWAADLWFVYKETAWFQNNQGVNTSGV